MGPWTTEELLNIAINFASGEEAIGAIFDRSKGKAKREEDVDEGTSNRQNKKRNKQRHKDRLVAIAERKRGQPPPEGTPGHFDKLLEGPCPNHEFPVKHAYKDCNLMKRFFAGNSIKGDRRRKPEEERKDAGEKEDGFPNVDDCFMIFSESAAYDSKHRRKLERREVYVAEPATPTFLDWSRSAITFDRSDHPEHVPQPGRYPLVVDPVVGTKHLTKVLMDGGSGLNILYAETLDAMGIN